MVYLILCQNMTNGAEMTVPSWKGTKEGCDWGYCHFLKRELTFYDFSLSECDIDHDSEWAKEHPVNTEFCE